MPQRAFHPLADLFPLIEGQELIDLANDIKERGLYHPILLHPDSSIIDGRNRYRACSLVGVEPRYETWDGKGSLLGLVVSLNLQRRHLDKSQRALLAGKAKKGFAEEAKERQRQHGGTAPGKKTLVEEVSPVSDGGKARDDAGKAFKVSGPLVDAGEKVAEHGTPELIDAVERGAVSVQAAAAIADLPAEEQTALVKKGRKEIIRQAKHRTQQRRKENRTARAATAAKTVELPKGQYHCLVIDPPWEMEKIERDERPAQVGFDYPTMNEAELMALPISRLAFRNCHLYLWTTHKHLELALRLAEAWGFKYECLMTWIKNVGFTPFSWMRSTEHVLFCRRGKLELLKVGARLDFSAKVREHSRKPAVFYEVVRSVSPGPRLDVFSREAHDGFEEWGNEAGKFKRNRA
jgi:N6-adenosine-specific RNA methylase IME4